MKPDALHPVATKVREAMKGFPRGTRFLLALSGGADSVALFHALIQLGIHFDAAHCNFHLRGEESNRDMHFVETLCRDKGVTLHTVHFNVEQYRREHKLSVEMACRELRYDYFRSLRDRHGYARLLTAHHADDNVETMFLNLLRGSGIAGLRAMLPDNGDTLRPMLEVMKREITDFLDVLQQPYMVDSTNLSSDYRRNYLRNDIIPQLEREWHGLKKAITRSLSILRAEEALLRQTLSNYDTLPTLPYTLLRGNEAASMILHSYLKPISLSPKTLSDILRTVNSDTPQSGRKWYGKTGIVYTTTHGIEWKAENRETRDDEISDDKGSAELPPQFNYAELVNDEDNFRVAIGNEDPYTLYVPLSPDRLIFRHYRQGDRISPLGMTGTQLVSKIFKDAKLTLSQKQEVWIVCHADTGEIIWIEGLKRSRKYVLTPGAPRILRIRSSASRL